jgi:hypothetical protein
VKNEVEKEVEKEEVYWALKEGRVLNRMSQ